MDTDPVPSTLDTSFFFPNPGITHILLYLLLWELYDFFLYPFSLSLDITCDTVIPIPAIFATK